MEINFGELLDMKLRSDIQLLPIIEKMRKAVQQGIIVIIMDEYLDNNGKPQKDLKAELNTIERLNQWLADNNILEL